MLNNNMKLLLEKDLRKVLIKNGLSEELADWAHSVSDKYSPFVANAAFFKNPRYQANPEEVVKSQEYIRLLPQIKDVISNLFKNPIKPILPLSPNNISLEQGNRLLSQLDYMKDWFDNPTRENREDPTKLSWEDAFRFAEEYHEAQEAKAGSSLQIKDDQEVIIKYPDGFYWLRLNASSCREEADAMGHCGSAQKGELFSLRDRNGYPFITAAIDEDAESSEQIYGRANTKPKEKFHKRILEILGKLNIQKVETKNYKDESFNVDDDVSDELKEWFEEEFGYYPTKGGTTQKEIDDAETRLRELNEDLDYVDVDVDFGSSDEYASVSCYMSIDITKYDVNDNISKDVINYGSFRIDLGDMQSNFPGEHNEIQLQDGQIQFYSNLGDYNLEDGSGFVRGSYRSQDSPTEWIEAAVSEVEDFDKNYTSYLAEFFDILYDNDVILKKPMLSELKEFTEDSSRFMYDEEDGCFVHIVIPEKKANGEILKLINDEDYKKEYIEKLNNLRVIDSFGIRRGGEYAEQLSFKDFFNDLEERGFKESKPLFSLTMNQNIVRISTTPLLELEYKDQEEIVKMLKFFDKNWSDLVFYVGSLLGINGDERRIDTLERAERLSKVMF
jgi:hypothetical protein